MMLHPGWLVLAFLPAAPEPADARALAATMADKAQTFLASLHQKQAKAAKFAIDDPARLDWHWIPKPRKGLTLGEMNPDQRNAGLALLETALSESGFAKAKIIFALEEVLRVQEKDDSGRRDRNKYHWCVFGTPGPTGRWGWSVEGHHLSVNLTISEGAVVSATPLFMGANPREMNAEFEGAPPPGHETLKDEEDHALMLIQSLPPHHRNKAKLGEATPKEVVTGPPSSLWNGEPQGLPAKEMTPEQLERLERLLASYCDRLAPALGAALLEEVKAAGIEKIHLAWFGELGKGQPHHYRLQGPTFLIDFDNSQADPLGMPANHIHSLWRSRAHDFGAGR